MSTATRTRQTTSAKLTGLAIPDCFATATLAAAIIATERPKARRNPRDARRLNDKVDSLIARGAL